MSPRLSSHVSAPDRIGANRRSVSEMAPTKMYKPYVEIDPVSALASRELAPYSD